MKLVHFSIDDASTAGARNTVTAGVQHENGDVSPVADLLGAGAPARIRDVLAAGPQLLDQLRRRAAKPGAALPAAGVRLHAPVGDDVLLLCAGANYRAHLEEIGDQVPDKAAWHIKNSRSIVGPGEPIRLPADADEMVDWEAEFSLVIGRTCFEVSADDAMSYIGGYTLLNDVSARDGVAAIQQATTAVEGRWAWTDMLLGKQFPTFAPLGPAIVTADEIDDVDSTRLTATVNGEIMQDARLDDLVVGIPQLVEYFSRYFRLEPGDVISTGTPAGVGAGRTPPRYLAAGDVVTIAATGLGELSNPVQ